MKEILDYIEEKYRPLTVIVYGSYADGTQNAHSDFDGIAVREAGPPCHDTGFVNGVPLDLFVYPKEHFGDDPDWDEILPIIHGQVVYDRDGLGSRLMEGVRAYAATLPGKSPEQIREELSWCRKMLLRAGRGDPEGLFRLHWLLVDSLEIFCDGVGEPFWGPKKSLKRMESAYPEAFARYARALKDPAALEDWIRCLEEAAGRRKL